MGRSRRSAWSRSRTTGITSPPTKRRRWCEPGRSSATRRSLARWRSWAGGSRTTRCAVSTPPRTSSTVTSARSRTSGSRRMCRERAHHPHLSPHHGAVQPGDVAHLGHRHAVQAARRARHLPSHDDQRRVHTGERAVRDPHRRGRRHAGPARVAAPVSRHAVRHHALVRGDRAVGVGVLAVRRGLRAPRARLHVLHGGGRRLAGGRAQGDGLHPAARAGLRARSDGVRSGDAGWHAGRRSAGTGRSGPAVPGARRHRRTVVRARLARDAGARVHPARPFPGPRARRDAPRVRGRDALRLAPSRGTARDAGLARVGELHDLRVLQLAAVFPGSARPRGGVGGGRDRRPHLVDIDRRQCPRDTPRPPAGTRTAMLMASVVVQAVAIVLCGLLRNFYVVVALYLVYGIALGVMLPVKQGYLNAHIPSAQRATIISLDSFFANLGGVAGQTGWGWLARGRGIADAWVAAGATLLLGVPLYALARRRDRQLDRF